jgi:hypothetical protein
MFAIRFLSVFFFILLIFRLEAVAQVAIDPKIDLTDTTQVHQLETMRGDLFIGRLITQEEQEITFLSNSGATIAFPASEVFAVTLFETPVEEDERPFHRYQDLFISPTAYNFAKGQKNYRNAQLILNRFDFGATDQYSIGVGTFLPFSVLLRSKWTTDSPSLFNFGVGLDLVFSVSGQEEQKRFVQFFTTTSIGIPQKHFNVGAAAIIDLRNNIASQYLFTVGGAFEIVSHFSILIDTIFIPQAEVKVLPGAGLSWAKGNNRADVGLFYFSDLVIQPVMVPGLAYSRSF